MFRDWLNSRKWKTFIAVLAAMIALWLCWLWRSKTAHGVLRYYEFLIFPVMFAVTLGIFSCKFIPLIVRRIFLGLICGAVLGKTLHYNPYHAYMPEAGKAVCEDFAKTGNPDCVIVSFCGPNKLKQLRYCTGGKIRIIQPKARRYDENFLPVFPDFLRSSAREDYDIYVFAKLTARENREILPMLERHRELKPIFSSPVNRKKKHFLWVIRCPREKFDHDRITAGSYPECLCRYDVQGEGRKTPDPAAQARSWSVAFERAADRKFLDFTRGPDGAELHMRGNGGESALLGHWFPAGFHLVKIEGAAAEDTELHVHITPWKSRSKAGLRNSVFVRYYPRKTDFTEYVFVSPQSVGDFPEYTLSFSVNGALKIKRITVFGKKAAQASERQTESQDHGAKK